MKRMSDFRFRILDLRAVILALGLCLALTARVSAQVGTVVTLLPNAKAEYRFDYRGDNSPMRVMLSAPGVQNLGLWIYTPSQIAAMGRGEQPQPIGRGTPSKEADLFWSGTLREGGTYRVVVENRNGFPIQYRLDVSGEAVSSVAQLNVSVPQASSNTTFDRGQSSLVVNFPPNSGVEALRLTVPPRPANCTPAKKIPATITQSIKLCPGEIYPPLKIAGNNIALFADDARSAVVTSTGRQFAVTAEGANIWIEGLVISARADPQDVNAWLCLYDECLFQTKTGIVPLHGGVRYGGGILLKSATNSTVRGVTVRGGTIGIATVDGKGNNLLDNELNDLNGWGSFNWNSTGAYFVNNQWHRNNHACVTPAGEKYSHGCETSGWVCLGCNQNFIISNRCELSANCFYINGDRNLPSNDNRFIANYCAGATDNCYEITFSRGNLLVNNVSTVDPKTGAACKYPFWVGGSVVSFQNNRWECQIGADDAFNQSRDSTVVGTNIINLDAFGQVPLAPAVRATPAPGSAAPVVAPSVTAPTLMRFPRGDVLEFVE